MLAMVRRRWRLGVAGWLLLAKPAAPRAQRRGALGGYTPRMAVGQQRRVVGVSHMAACAQALCLSCRLVRRCAQVTCVLVVGWQCMAAHVGAHQGGCMGTHLLRELDLLISKLRQHARRWQRATCVL